jgi:hypothetical protein
MVDLALRPVVARLAALGAICCIVPSFCSSAHCPRIGRVRLVNPAIVRAMVIGKAVHGGSCTNGEMLKKNKRLQHRLFYFGNFQ